MIDLPPADLSQILYKELNKPGIVQVISQDYATRYGLQLLFAQKGSDIIKEYRNVLRNLEISLKDTLKLPDNTKQPCYTPKNGDRCYKFRVKEDGTLVAVFVYNINAYDEPTQLDHIVHIKKVENATIIYYNMSFSKNMEFWERFWRKPHNVADIIMDEGGIEENMKKLFENYLLQNPKQF